jgi:hypothetical protein
MADFNVKALEANLDFDKLPYWLNEKRLRDNKIALIGEKISQAARARKRLA